MRAPGQRAIVLTLFLAALTTIARGNDETDSQRASRALFLEKVEPFFQRECYSCHSGQADTVEASLRLDSPAGLRAGGDNGPIVDTEQPSKSLLIRALRHEDGLAMPPDRPPSVAEWVDAVERWIALGAVDPRAEPAPTPSSSGGGIDLAKARAHWSFQPLREPDLPDVVDLALADQAVDVFLLEKLEARQWTFAAEASRRDWLRRITFDVTGLPPEPEQLDAFEADGRPDARERVVDRLLASPRFGEHMAQHWLDLVRYAESEGYEYDRHIPDAWRYRDYVVQSLGADKPFDRFVSEQVAGDEIDPSNRECLTAAIFHRLGPVRRNAGNPEIALSRNEVLTERTDIIGAAFLGLTVACARCHNHKLEPITQKDYYQLQAYLAATEENNISLSTADEQAAWEAASQQTRDEIKRLQAEAKRLAGEAKDKVTAAIDKLEQRLPAPLPAIPSIRNDLEKRTKIHVLRRGAWELKGQPVSPRPVSVLVPETTPALPEDCPQPRTQLARWLTSVDNPLTPRVIVNRLWQSCFGQGIVRTANDFGLRGDSPSHRELLDWLASRLLEHHWELKSLHRSLLLSRAYRQSARPTNIAALEAADPENRLLARFTRRRLSAEEIRDSMLAVSGQLNGQIGGPSIMLPADDEMVNLLYKPSQWKAASDRADHGRRSLYLIAKRNLRLPLLENLDAPTLLGSCARRETSTHAPQALELMNGWQSNWMATEFAELLRRQAGAEPAAVAELAFRRALGRLPNERERALAIAFLREQPLSEFALALFNLNEFLYVQ